MDDEQQKTDNLMSQLVADAITKLVENAPSIESRDKGLECIGEFLKIT